MLAHDAVRRLGAGPAGLLTFGQRQKYHVVLSFTCDRFAVWLLAQLLAIFHLSIRSWILWLPLTPAVSALLSR